MSTYFPHIITSVALLLLGAINLLLIWGLHRRWWKDRSVRRLVITIPTLGIALVGLWAVLTAMGWVWGARIVATLPALLFLISAALTLSLPFSGAVLILERFAKWLGAITNGKEKLRPFPNHAPEGIPAVNTSRRSFIATSAAILPVAAAGSATYGIVNSENALQITPVDLYFDQLHPDLEGLRILHLSDIHIGYFIDLHTLERDMLAAEKVRPDIVLLTGDVSDYLPELPTALTMINGLKPRYGVYASLGNHEYYRGIKDVLTIFDAGPIPLLKDSGAAVKIGGGTLYVGGADDPVSMGSQGANARFLRTTTDAAFDGAPSDAFHLLMSHRPEGFDAAGELNIPMTVSGHTHAGMQLGFGGRSVLERLFGMRYMWGRYQKENGSQLYTSAGMGHWFPFRLGVPREAPLYTLHKKM